MIIDPNELNKVNMSIKNTQPVTPGGVLVSLMNGIKKKLGLYEDIGRYKEVIEAFVNNDMAYESSRSHLAKSALFNELSKPSISIKVFYKFMRLVGGESVTLSVKLKTRDGQVIESEYTTKLHQ